MLSAGGCREQHSVLQHANSSKGEDLHPLSRLVNPSKVPFLPGSLSNGGLSIAESNWFTMGHAPPNVCYVYVDKTRLPGNLKEGCVRSWNSRHEIGLTFNAISPGLTLLGGFPSLSSKSGELVCAFIKANSCPNNCEHTQHGNVG